MKKIIKKISFERYGLIAQKFRIGTWIILFSEGYSKDLEKMLNSVNPSLTRLQTLVQHGGWLS